MANISYRIARNIGAWMAKKVKEIDKPKIKKVKAKREFTPQSIVKTLFGDVGLYILKMDKK